MYYIVEGYLLPLTVNKDRTNRVQIGNLFLDVSDQPEREMGAQWRSERVSEGVHGMFTECSWNVLNERLFNSVA